jgi:hypothetical protein
MFLMFGSGLVFAGKIAVFENATFAMPARSLASNLRCVPESPRVP